MNPNQQTGTTQQQVKDKAENLANQAQDKAGDVLDKAQETAKTTITQQKGRAAEMVDSIADALHQTGQHLEDNNQAPIANFAHQAATRLEQFSDDLQNKSVDEMVGGVEDFARRDPQLFLGGAVVLGLLAARFFKASARRQQQRQGYMGGQRGQYQYRPYGRYGQYGPTYGERYADQGQGRYERRALPDEYMGATEPDFTHEQSTSHYNDTYTTGESTSFSSTTSGTTSAAPTNPDEKTSQNWSDVQGNNWPDENPPRGSEK